MERGGAAAASLAVLLAFALGLGLPDVDFHVPLLDHRSALTHSALLPALLYLRAPTLACGLALGIGVHLLADNFPSAMIGYATVKLPFLGSLGSAASYLWLAVNALASLALGTVALRWLPAPAIPAVALIATAGTVAYLATTDGGWWVLALLALAAWLTWRFRRS